MVTRSSILAWRIPWTEEPGGLYSPWGHKESDTTEQLHTQTHTHTQPLWLLGGGLDFPSECRLVWGSALTPQQLCRFAAPRLTLWIRALKDGGKPDEHTSASMETSKEELPAEDLRKALL